jgi:hypothetical protein
MSCDATISLAPGCKCQRCRKFAIEVGLIVQWPDLCRDCAIFMEVVRLQPAYDRLQRQLLDHPLRRLAHDPSVPGVIYPDGLIEIWPRGAEEAPWLASRQTELETES